jgi:hypothetical protein
LAKRREDLPKFTLVIPFRKPDKPKQVRIFTPTCGCGREAEYEVYDILQPHCKSCMEEAMSSSIKPFVREIGGFDDAS